MGPHVEQEGDSDRYRAPALDKGLDIIELLSATDGGLTQAEIAKGMGHKANEFYRMLDRLLKRGYVTKEEGGKYALTLKLFGLAQLHTPVRRLASYATPLMRDLAERSRQANHLAVFDRGSPVVIAQQEAPGYWGVSIRVGSHISLFDTGSGHVLLAFRSPEERRLMVSEYVGHSGSNPLTPDLSERLDRIQARGYEKMASTQTAGVYNLSAPVLGADRRAMAVLSCPYIPFIDAVSAPGIDMTVAMLQETATELSRLAGCS